jgi:hypothetical protein
MFLIVKKIVLENPFSKVISILTFILLMWRIGRATNSIPIYSYIQQDETLHSLFIFGNCSTCFGWYCAINVFKYFDPQSCKYFNHFKTNVKGTVNFIQ